MVDPSKYMIDDWLIDHSDMWPIQRKCDWKASDIDESSEPSRISESCETSEIWHCSPCRVYSWPCLYGIGFALHGRGKALAAQSSPLSQSRLDFAFALIFAPFQSPVALQIWPRPHNTQEFSTKLNYIRLEVRGPPAHTTSDTDGQGKSGSRICSPPCRTADCTGLGSWCMESRTKTWARAMFFSSEIGMRVFHLVQAGREHCIDWLVEDERRAATSSSSNPSPANSTHPTHKRASRIKSGKHGLVQATRYAIISTIFFMHFPHL